MESSSDFYFASDAQKAIHAMPNRSFRLTPGGLIESHSIRKEKKKKMHIDFFLCLLCSPTRNVQADSCSLTPISKVFSLQTINYNKKKKKKTKTKQEKLNTFVTHRPSVIYGQNLTSALEFFFLIDV